VAAAASIPEPAIGSASDSESDMVEE
jgi:hypothetical protein